jgi:hypothetical protein
MISLPIWSLIGCAAPPNLLHKEEISEFGAKTKYTYYLTKEGSEVRHGWYRQTADGFSLNTKYKHGRVEKSEGSQRSTDPWSIYDQNPQLPRQ